MRTLEQIQQQFERWGQETNTTEAFKNYYGMRDADSELREMLQDEKDEERRAHICQLGSDIAENLWETKQYLARLEPLQGMVVEFADGAQKVANKVGCSRLADRCRELKSFCDYEAWDFRCWPRFLTLHWTKRVLQLRADLLAVKDDICLNLKDAQYDRYRENIEQLQAEYKAISDYLEQWDESKERAERIRDDQSGQAEQPGSGGPKKTGTKGGPPPDLIRSCVAVKRYYVSRSTLKRNVQQGKLKSYRSPDAPPNAPHLFSEKGIAATWPKR